MSEAELRGKFTECARQAIDEKGAARALNYIEGLEALQDVRALGEILKG
jgi:hypothetical protein